MKKQNIIPKYAHLEYQVLHELEVSIGEYWLLDMVHRLSRIGWCNKKLENIAFDMRMTKKGVIQMRDRLIGRKLLIKGIGNRLKTSEKVNKSYFIEENQLEKVTLVPKKVNKVPLKSNLSSSKTSVENNNRITIEYKKARAVSDEIRSRFAFLKPS